MSGIDRDLVSAAFREAGAARWGVAWNPRLRRAAPLVLLRSAAMKTRIAGLPAAIQTHDCDDCWSNATQYFVQLKYTNRAPSALAPDSSS